MKSQVSWSHRDVHLNALTVNLTKEIKMIQRKVPQNPINWPSITQERNRRIIQNNGNRREHILQTQTITERLTWDRSQCTFGLKKSKYATCDTTQRHLQKSITTQTRIERSMKVAVRGQWKITEIEVTETKYDEQRFRERNTVFSHLQLPLRHKAARTCVSIKKVNGRDREARYWRPSSLYKSRTRRLIRAAAANATNKQCDN